MESSDASMTWSRPLGVWLMAALLLTVGVLVILFDVLGIEAGLSNRQFDAYQRHASRPLPENLPVRVLELPVLDEDSLVKVTRALAGQGVGVIAFTGQIQAGASPLSLAARLPPGSDAARAALAKLPEPGHDLAQAITEIKTVIPVNLGSAGRDPHIKARFVYRGTVDPFASVPAFHAASAEPALLESNAAGSGAINLPTDSDGVVRRMPLAFHLGSVLVPGLAAETLRIAQQENELTFVSNEHDPTTFLTGIGIGALQTKQKIVPTDGAGRIRLRYAADPARRMIDPDAPFSAGLKDAIVLIGIQGQVVRTPLGPASVSSVMAEGIEDLLEGQVLTRPGWARALEVLFLLVPGAGVIFLLRYGLGWAAVLVMAAAAGLGLLSWYLYAVHGLLLDAATPVVFLVLAYGAGAAAWIQEMRLAYARLRMAFSDSLPQATIEKIARRPGLLRLEGETRTVTYLVCGVRGLAELASAYKEDAAGFTKLMQRVLTPLIDQAMAHGGTIDRLTADGFAAFWNAPLDDGEHALHACDAANGMTVMLAQVSQELAQLKEERLGVLEIGVGVATGSVIAGGFGGSGRMGYSVHGNAVSLAQRIQALSHRYGPALVVAEETKRAAERGFAFLEIDTIAMGGTATTLYAIMGNPVARASPKFRALTVFHDHIFQAIRKQNWSMARDLIAQCRRLSGASQKLYELHLTRIAYYEQHPPGAEWDGAFRPVLE
jgi:adenylate cyclase